MNLRDAAKVLLGDKSFDVALKVLFATDISKELIDYAENELAKSNSAVISQAGQAGAVPYEPLGQFGSPTIPESPLQGTIYENQGVPPITVSPGTQHQIDLITEAIKNGQNVEELLKRLQGDGS